MLSARFNLFKTGLLATLLLAPVLVNAQKDIIQQAWALEWAGKSQEAYEKFKVAIEQYPDSSRAWKGKADMEMKVLNDSDDAIDDYNRAIQLKPKALWAFFERGKIKLGRRAYSEALDDFTKAIEIKSDYGEFYNLRAICKSRKWDHYGAIKDFTEAINLQPASAVLYYNRAIEYKWIAKYDMAIADLNKALELKPGYADARDMLAKTQKAKTEKPKPVIDYHYTPTAKDSLLAIKSLALEKNHIRATSSADSVKKGEMFEVSYMMDEEDSAFRAPSFKGFKVVNTSTSTSVEMTNGIVVRSKSYSFQLMAQSIGKFTIDPASAYIQGVVKWSNNLSIKVTPGKYIPVVDKSDSIYQNLFVKIIPSKTSAYEGEQVILSAKIYSRVILSNTTFSKSAETHNYSAYSIFLNPSDTVNSRKEKEKGKEFTTYTIKTKALFAKHSGNLKLDADTIRCIATTASKDSKNMSGILIYSSNIYDIVSDRPTIEVVPLPPTDKPFSGLVGLFKQNVSVNYNNLKPGDTVHVKVSLTGNGNLRLQKEIPYSFPGELKPLPPKITDSTYEIADGLVFSNRSFDYALILKSGGLFEIPKTSINYFDPYKKNYAELSIPGFTLNVNSAGKN